MHTKISIVFMVILSLIIIGGEVMGQINDDKNREQTNNFLKHYEPLIDNALWAYNKEDCKTFYKDYAIMLANIATELAFKTMYIDMYKEKYGKFVSKTLIREKSVYVDSGPLLVYKAIFEKNSNIQISVNFTKERDGYKITQISFDEIPEASSQTKDKGVGDNKNIEIEIKGSKSSLQGQDLEFVNFWQTLRDDYRKRQPYIYRGNLSQASSRKKIWTLDDYTLTKLDYEEILDPSSTGALTITFWRSDKGFYFFRVSGGCFWYRDELFGPFHFEKGKFTFSYSVIETEKFSGAIFQSTYDINFLFREYGRWTPQKEDVIGAERLLKEYILENAPNIDKKLSQYRRQYFGLIDKDGEKIIWINCFLDYEDYHKNWKADLVYVLDGGLNFFEIKVNLKTRKCFDLYVHGEA